MDSIEAGIFLKNITNIDGDTLHNLMINIPTPSSLSELENSEIYSQTIKRIDDYFLAQAEKWGPVYGFIQEQNGALIQNIFPIKKFQDEQISSSSKVLLELHTETAFHPYKPRYLALFCIRADPSAHTFLAFLSDILKNLSEETKTELRKNQFSTSLDESFKSDRQPDKTISTSILTESDSALIYDRALMKGLNESAQKALDDLNGVIDKCIKSITLKTGQMLVIDNKKCIHGRAPFSPKYDGTDRWLKRALIQSAPIPLPELAEGRSKNIISTRF